MGALMQGIVGENQVSKWLPWALGATMLLYFIGMVDGTVHAAAFGGSESVALNYVHEFFHHGRHFFLMCH